MTRTTRITIVTLQTLIAAGWISAAGCSSTNDPATSTGGTAGDPVTPPGTGGTTSSGGSGGTTGTGGASGTSTGGYAGTGGATGGSGGATGGSAGSGTGGSGVATDGGGSTTYAPACANNAAGVAIAKGVACTAADPQLCWKTCGPASSGFKPETCTAGLYAEEPGGPPCHFPPADYACYKIPATVDTTCPATPPQASMDCTVAACTPCNAGGSYLDSSGATKTGYCVCPAAGASGSRKWSCASATAWPCPGNTGC